MRKNISLPIVILLLALSYFGCKNESETVIQKRMPISVSVDTVQEQTIKEYVTFNGVTQYQKKEKIRSNVTGYISWMKYKIGDRIGRGQTFASIRTKEQDALKEAVKIDSSLKKFISPVTIQSNASGFITTLEVTTNDYVAEGDILATVAEPRSLVVQVNVPFEKETKIQIGTPCEIILQNGKTIIANITGALPTIDSSAQSQLFLIALPDGDLPENLNVQIKVVDEEAIRAKTVPKTALQTNELLTDFWVMKVVNDSLAIKQKVEPLLKNDSLVQVISEGLKLNDLVITEGAYQMQDSTLVSIKKL